MQYFCFFLRKTLRSHPHWPSTAHLVWQVPLSPQGPSTAKTRLSIFIFPPARQTRHKSPPTRPLWVHLRGLGRREPSDRSCTQPRPRHPAFTTSQNSGSVPYLPFLFIPSVLWIFSSSWWPSVKLHIPLTKSLDVPGIPEAVASDVATMTNRGHLLLRSDRNFFSRIPFLRFYFKQVFNIVTFTTIFFLVPFPNILSCGRIFLAFCDILVTLWNLVLWVRLACQLARTPSKIENTHI